MILIQQRAIVHFYIRLFHIEAEELSIKFQNIADFIDLAAAWGGNKTRAGEVVNVAQISSLQGTMKSNNKR